MADVYPYRSVEFDRRVVFSNGVAYRFITYANIEGREDAPGAAVFDDTHKLVLIDGLYANEKGLQERLQALIDGGLERLVAEVNAHPQARHKLAEDGSIPW